MRTMKRFMMSLPALAAWPALAIGCPAPVPLHLQDDGAPLAVLFHPQGWEAGDAAAVLRDGPAFRDGCASPGVAALLEQGVLVLAMAPAGVDWGRLDAALAILREGYGARHAVVLPAPGQPPGPGFARPIRRAAAAAPPAGSSSRPSSE
jgi:hypothetical protein